MTVYGIKELGMNSNKNRFMVFSSRVFNSESNETIPNLLRIKLVGKINFR